MPSWSVRDIPDQSGRVAVITGATGGLGYEAALALAAAGAEVVLTGRSADKGADAVARITAAQPTAKLRFLPLDVASLVDIGHFADKMLAEARPIDLLLNNAGVMALPRRMLTVDGFEKQFGTNYLGHFALTGRLLPLLIRGASPRVVTVSSLAARAGFINFGDLQSVHYAAWAAYSQSKLANLMFAMELQRRSDAKTWGLRSIAAHPGWARTNLMSNGPSAGGPKGIVERVAEVVAPILGQSAAAGALPLLFAATAPDAAPGVMYGPGGLAEMKGPPKLSWITPQAKNLNVAAKLWEVSEALTGVSYGH
jgi:NAD(P)-dependent dehydrogenase (short-subunit alcohol dehydrogenase family)